MNTILKDFKFANEPVKQYLPGSPERIELERELDRMTTSFVEIPVIIGGKEIRTGHKEKCVMPHNHSHVLGECHLAGVKEAELAIETTLKAKAAWESLPWQSRASVFLRAAELAAGPWRARLNAATMLGQSKTYKQAEIDSACELVDFLRYNAACLHEIYGDQPISTNAVWNRIDYRPLEGFIFAITPFNFTAIGGNLCAAPALLGNTVIWKPALTAVYSSYVVYQLFKAAGLPDGVINFLPCAPGEVTDLIIHNPNLSGIHFTGSTATFQHLWKTVGNNIAHYKSFPRLVGETGGKDFVIVHPSADLDAVLRGLIDGAFEYQGQKCSAASRAYIPESCWPYLKEKLGEKVKKLVVADVSRSDTFMGAVIDKKSFDRIAQYIEYAKSSPDAEILFGGNYDDSVGYFVEPTVILTKNPKFKTMVEEIFGPVLTIYLYADHDFEKVLTLCDQTSQYALTGAVFAKDPYAIVMAERALVHSAGNFYINVKPTGAMVGQQPFGGARLSGTNDKAGSKLNLLRWISPRTIKDNLI